MPAAETQLEMVQRHVCQGTKRVTRQRVIITELAERKQPTDLAESLLADFENCLDAHKNRLARLILI